MEPTRPSDQTFDILATPDTGELAFRVAVATKDLARLTLPSEGTTYADCPFPNKPRLNELAWSTYKLTMSAPAAPGWVWYYFGKPKTADQAGTAYREVTGSRHFDWPAVLYGVVFVRDAINQVRDTRATTSGNRTQTWRPGVNARKVMKPGVFALCRTITRYYLNTEPFTLKANVQPSAGYVEWNYKEARGSMSALHDDLTLPADGTHYDMAANNGGVIGVSRPPNQRFFPATPMIDWSAFVIEDDQRQTEAGVWQRVTTTLYPPPSSEEGTF